jgi:DNA-directed RNA polymerase specialized sigma24 family protein
MTGAVDTNQSSDPRPSLWPGHETNAWRSGQVDCAKVARYAGVATSGFLPPDDLRAVARHVQGCPGCVENLSQTATASALIGLRLKTRPSAAAPVVDAMQDRDGVGDAQTVLTSLARQLDPAHADDLVQDTWDHFLEEEPSRTPRREDLTAYLLLHASDHREADEGNEGEYVDTVLAHHAHLPTQEAHGDLPAGFGAYGSLRELAALDALDPDADAAELLLPELYSDGDDRGSWVSPPTAWPHATQFLGPAEDIQTHELYAVVDAALDELPPPVANVLYLLDVEGLSLHDAATLLGTAPKEVQRALARGRHHVRGRVDSYVKGQ